VALPRELDQVQTTRKTQRHQVTGLPPIQPFLIEYECPKVVCPCRGEGTRASLPEESTGDFGPRLMALIAYLTIMCRMPRRVVEAFPEHVLGISMSLGSTQMCWEQASAAVAEPCRELEQQLKNEPVLNSDETGWRNNGEKRYLWALVARNFVFYMVDKTRSSIVLVHLLGAVFAGILCSGRYSAYFKYHKGLTQRAQEFKAHLCWAHLQPRRIGPVCLPVPHLAQVPGRLDRPQPIDRPLDSAAKALVQTRREVPGQ
jgi:transposase